MEASSFYCADQKITYWVNTLKSKEQDFINRAFKTDTHLSEFQKARILKIIKDLSYLPTGLINLNEQERDTFISETKGILKKFKVYKKSSQTLLKKYTLFETKIEKIIKLLKNRVSISINLFTGGFETEKTNINKNYNDILSYVGISLLSSNYLKDVLEEKLSNNTQEKWKRFTQRYQEHFVWKTDEVFEILNKIKLMEGYFPQNPNANTSRSSYKERFTPYYRGSSTPSFSSSDGFWSERPRASFPFSTSYSGYTPFSGNSANFWSQTPVSSFSSEPDRKYICPEWSNISINEIFDPMENPHEFLGIPKWIKADGKDKDEFLKYIKKLTIKYHPDKHPAEWEKFNKISQTIQEIKSKLANKHSSF